MTKDEALRLALEALAEMKPSGPNGSAIWHKQMSAITAASDALAQPEQEPVGVVESALRFAGGFHVKLFRDATMPDVGSLIYTTPPQPKELEATERQVEILSDELSKCSKALRLALEALEKFRYHVANNYEINSAIVAAREALAQPEQRAQLLFEVDGEMLTASQLMGVELFNFQQATGCDTAAEFLAQTEQIPPSAYSNTHQPKPPPECQTEAEKTAFAFGWFKAMEAQRAQPEQKSNDFCEHCGMKYCECGERK